MSSSKSVSWKRFPIGELARKRKALREDYMAADSETARLQDEVNIAQRDVNKLKKKV
jgi:outer membrane murein-binding lipoprotein Lpp